MLHKAEDEALRQFVRSDKVATVVNNKKSYFEACLRNGLLMPNFKDSIVTIPMMDEIREKTIWLPKAVDCCGYTVVNPPSKLVLAEYNAEALRKRTKDASGRVLTREERDAC